MNHGRIHRIRINRLEDDTDALSRYLWRRMWTAYQLSSLSTGASAWPTKCGNYLLAYRGTSS